MVMLPSPSTCCFNAELHCPPIALELASCRTSRRRWEKVFGRFAIAAANVFHVTVSLLKTLRYLYWRPTSQLLLSMLLVPYHDFGDSTTSAVTVSELDS